MSDSDKDKNRKITKDEIKHIAFLAKLEFTDQELEKFEKKFNDILDYVSLIKECDTSDIEFEHHMDDYSGEVLQDDIHRPSLPKEKLLMNATEGRNKSGFVVTSKIVNKE